jgi:hypothetical protein
MPVAFPHEERTQRPCPDRPARSTGQHGGWVNHRTIQRRIAILRVTSVNVMSAHTGEDLVKWIAARAPATQYAAEAPQSAGAATTT